MIIDDLVMVKWNVSNHYESLGYKLTKMRDAFMVSALHLPIKSKIQVRVKCNDCGIVRNTRRAIAQDICGKCKIKKQERTWKTWELEMLESVFPRIHDVHTLAKTLRRSKNAVQLMANRKGIKRKIRKNTPDDPFSFNGTVTPTMAMIFMYHLGDGWISKCGRTLKTGTYSESFQGGFSGDQEGLANIQKDVATLFGNDHCSQIQTEDTFSPKYNIRGVSNSFYISTALIKHLLLLEAVIGRKTSVPLLLPKWLMDASLEVKVSVLSGLYSAEGTIFKMQTNDKTLRAPGFCITKRKIFSDNFYKFLTDYAVSSEQASSEAKPPQKSAFRIIFGGLSL